MFTNRLFRSCSICLPVVCMLCITFWLHPVTASTASLSASEGSATLDRYSQSPRRQLHSRTGARYEAHLPGSVTEEEPVDEDVVLAEGVDINSASEEELAAALPGIGPSKARNIVEWRETQGPFQSIEQLLEVSGIGPRTLENIRPFVRLGDALSLREESPSQTTDEAEAAVVRALSPIIQRAERDRREALLADGDAANRESVFR